MHQGRCYVGQRTTPPTSADQISEARQNKPPTFHMTLLARYDLTDEDGRGFIRFRRSVHNIWDWGLLKDIPAAEKTLGKIMAA